MLTDQELQTLRNIGNEAESAAGEIVMLRERCEAMQAVALKFFEALAKADPEGAKRFADSLPNDKAHGAGGSFIAGGSPGAAGSAARVAEKG